MRYMILALIGSLSLSAYGNALAEQPSSSVVSSISTLPDKGSATLTGTVEKIDGPREFTLRDDSGDIKVRLTTNESFVFKPGDTVSVTGTVEEPFFGLGGKRIDASYVHVQKTLGSALSDTVTNTTGISMDQATPAQINSLPDQGMVKVTGAVDNVVNAKDFILKDPTGSIDVNIQSDENVALARGADVTVVGYVAKSPLGNKSIRATHVMVTSNTPNNKSGVM